MSVQALIDRLTAAGIRLTIDGDKLRVRGPELAITSELQEELRDSKAEVMAALRERTAPLGEGCLQHETSAAQIGEWWAAAARQDADVTCCACCGGPAPAEHIVCKRCGPLAPELEPQLVVAPLCARCAAPGHTYNVEAGWLCAPCWRHAAEREAGAA